MVHLGPRFLELERRWKWALSAVCASGVLGLVLAVWASLQHGSSLLHTVGVQAVYISSLGMLLWRMIVTLQSYVPQIIDGIQQAILQKKHIEQDHQAAVDELTANLHDAKRMARAAGDDVVRMRVKYQTSERELQQLRSAKGLKTQTESAGQILPIPHDEEVARQELADTKHAYELALQRHAVATAAQIKAAHDYITSQPDRDAERALRASLKATAPEAHGADPSSALVQQLQKQGAAVLSSQKSALLALCTAVQRDRRAQESTSSGAVRTSSGAGSAGLQHASGTQINAVALEQLNARAADDADAHEQLQSMRAELASQAGERAALKSSVAQADAAVADLQTALTQSEARCMELEAALELKQTTLLEAEAAVEESQNAHAGVRADLEARVERDSALEEERGDAISTLRAELDAANAEQERLASCITDLKAQLAESEMVSAQWEDATAEAQAALQVAQEDAAESRGLEDSLQAQIKEARLSGEAAAVKGLDEADLPATMQHLLHIKRDHQGLVTLKAEQLAVLEEQSANITVLEEQCTKLVSAREQLRANHAEILQQVEVRETTISQLKAKLHEAGSNAEKTLSEKSVELDRSLEQVNKIRTQLLSKEVELKEAKEKMDALQAQVEKLNASLAHNEAAAESKAKSQLATAKCEAQELQEALIAARNECTAISQQLESANGELLRLRSAVTAAEHERETLCSTVSALERKLASAQSDASAAADAHTRSKAQMEDAHAKTQARLEDAHAKTQAQLEELHASSTLLQAELNVTKEQLADRAAEMMRMQSAVRENDKHRRSLERAVKSKESELREESAARQVAQEALGGAHSDAQAISALAAMTLLELQRESAAASALRDTTSGGQDEVSRLQADLASQVALTDSLQAQLSQARAEASEAKRVAEEVLNPGIDVLVAQLEDAEEAKARLQEELRSLQQGATASAGPDPAGDGKLQAELAQVKSENEGLRKDVSVLSSDLKESASIRAELKEDVSKLMKLLHNSVEPPLGAFNTAVVHAAGHGEPKRSPEASAEELVAYILHHLGTSGMLEGVHQMPPQSYVRQGSQSQTIEDLNVLLDKRQREIKRLRSRLQMIQKPMDGKVTLPQLAARAAMAQGLETENEALRRELEALKNGELEDGNGANGSGRGAARELSVGSSSHLHDQLHVLATATLAFKKRYAKVKDQLSSVEEENKRLRSLVSQQGVTLPQNILLPAPMSRPVPR